MAERLSYPESSDDISLLTVSVSELVCEPLGVFNPGSPSCLYEDINNNGNFKEVFSALDGYVSGGLHGSRCEQLVEMVVASDGCPATKTVGGGLEKKLCRHLEISREPMQDIRIALDPAGSKPVRAVIRFNQSVLSNQTAVVEMNYGPDGEVILKTTRLNIPGEGEQKPMVISLAEDRRGEDFIRRAGIVAPERTESGEQLNELYLEKKLCMQPGRAECDVAYRITRKTRDKLSGEVADEESKPIR